MKSNNIEEKHFKYTSPFPEDYFKFDKIIRMSLSAFIEKINIPKESISMNNRLLIDIHTRIDQRKDYYQYFHSDKEYITYMSQAKEVALLCYWIVKYKPLTMTNELMENFSITHNCTINEMFAYYIMKSFISCYYENRDVDYAKFFNTNTKNVIIYNFMHRDMNKEFFILYITSLIFVLEV